AFVAPRVDVACVPDRHLRVRRMQTSHVLVGKPVLRADENFPQRPFVAHAAACSRAACFFAYATAASRTHAPSSHALTRVRMRSRLHGPWPFSTSWNSCQSISPKS